MAHERSLDDAGRMAREFREERERKERANGNGKFEGRKPSASWSTVWRDCGPKLTTWCASIVHRSTTSASGPSTGLLPRRARSSARTLTTSKGAAFRSPEPEPWPEPIDGPVLLDC